MSDAVAATPGAPAPAQPSAAPRRAWNIWAPVLIILAGLAAYSDSFNGPFVFDDPPSITENPTIRQGWLKALAPAMENGAPTAAGRPLVNLTLALNYDMGGFDVRGYHAVNLAIHLLAGLTLYGLVRRTLETAPLPQGGQRDACLPALVAALLWTLHPLQTESVTYINQRAEALVGLFYLLTLYFFARSVQARRPWAWLMSAAAACLLGMASKEVMATAPLMVLLYDRTFVAGSFRASLRARGSFYAVLAASWALLGYLVLSTKFRAETVGFDTGMNWRAYALKQCEALVLYLKLCLWPEPLVLDYGADVVTRAAAVWPQILLLALLLGGVLHALLRRQPWGFLGAWFFIILAPTSSVIPLTMETIAERRAYLPLAAIMTALVLGLRMLAGKRGIAACLLLAIAFGMLTFARNQDYLAKDRILRDSVAKTPGSFRALQNLGVELARAGRLAESAQCFLTVLRVAPDDAETENNLGNALLLSSRPGEALLHYRRAVTLKPSHVEARNNLGTLLFRSGQPQDAAEQFEALVRLVPNSIEARINLANAYNFSDRPSLGLPIYEEVLRKFPSSADAQYGMGNSLFLLNRPAEAARAYAAAVKLNPRSAQNHTGLANALLMLNRLDDAIVEYREALRLDPASTAARDGLEAALARQRSNRNAVPQP